MKRPLFLTCLLLLEVACVSHSVADVDLPVVSTHVVLDAAEGDSGERVDPPEWYQAKDAPSPWTGRVGIGFTSSPSTFLLAATADKEMSKGVTAGPMLQLGLDGNEFIFAPSYQVKRMFEIHGKDDKDKVVALPYLQGGAGLVYIDKTDADGFGFLVHAGGGIDIPIGDNSFLGTTMTFNLLPATTAREKLFFAWQLVTFRFEF